MNTRKNTRQLHKMFELFTISETEDFAEFVLGDLNHLPWLLKEPVITKISRRGGYPVKVRNRPRITFKGKRDYVVRQLYRHFVGELGSETLIPIKDRSDYNPRNWKIGNERKETPTSLKTAPKAVDPELQDLVDEIERRISRGDADIWQGVDEVFTAFEIAQVKELLDGQNKT